MTTPEHAVKLIQGVIRDKTWADISDLEVNIIKRAVLAACGKVDGDHDSIRGVCLQDALVFSNTSDQQYRYAVGLVEEDTKLLFVNLSPRRDGEIVTFTAHAGLTDLGLALRCAPVVHTDATQRIDNLFNTQAFMDLIK